MSSEEVFSALTSKTSLDELALLVKQWKDAGLPKAEAEARLSAFRSVLVAAGDQAGEDRVLDLLDFVTGFCSPENRIY